jgi:hypothetical protein
MALWSMLVGSLQEAFAWSVSPVPQQHPRKSQPNVKPRQEFDLLRAAERDTIIASHVNALLQPLGFVQVAPRRWVDGSAAPIRCVFEMQLLKGAAMKAVWGFSLDFVPHLSGGRVRWHRSNRTASFDLSIELHERMTASFLRGAPRLRDDLERLVPAALEAAQETWRRGSTLVGVLDIVREIRERKIKSFYMHFSWRLPITFMFLSAKIGDLATAQAELESYARKYELGEDLVFKLAKLLRDLAPVEAAASGHGAIQLPKTDRLPQS